MAKVLPAVTAMLLAVTAGLVAACCLAPTALLLTLAISFGTTAYHFAMRLAVGLATARIMGGRADVTRRRYRLCRWEPPLYEALRVRRWKAYVPTYDPDAFDPVQHSWSEIAQAMCQSETVHSLCAAFSFLPLLLILPFGQPVVFILTSVLGALIDLCFVMVQRYNRPTVLRLAAREKRRAA